MMRHFQNVTFWKTSLESSILSIYLCLSQVDKSVLFFITYILVSFCREGSLAVTLSTAQRDPAQLALPTFGIMLLKK